MTSTKSSERRHDDLSAIKGIGEATQRSLNEALGVRTYEDLATCSINVIEAELKSSGRNTSRNQIEEWLAQARELAGAPIRSMRREERPGREREAVEPQPALGEAHWKPIATFVVEFQSRTDASGIEERRTACQQHETAREQTWPGIDCERTCEWMLAQIEAHPKPVLDQLPTPEMPTPAESPFAAPERPSAGARSASSPPVTVEVTGVRAFQPLESETPRAVATAGGNFSGVVTPDEPVSFEVAFQIGGPTATEIADSYSGFTAEVFAVNRRNATRERIFAPGPGSIAVNESSYTMVLPELTLPSGMYRLECIATLVGVHPAKGYLEVPFLRVA
jgi:hypothetical protein